MSDSPMQRLMVLAKRLSPSELSSARAIISVHPSEIKKSRQLALLNELCHTDQEEKLNKALTQMEAFHSTAILDQTRRDVKARIEEALLLPQNYQQPEAYDPVSLAYIETLNAITLIELYRFRGLQEEVSRLLNSAFRLAQKFEFYTYLIQIADTANALGKFASLGYSGSYEECIRFCEHGRKACINASKAYYRTIQNYSFKGNHRNAHNEVLLNLLEEDINSLKRDFESSGSAFVGYHYYLLQIELFQLRGRFDKASEYCLFLVEIIKNNPSIYMKQRVGIAYLNLSQNEIYNFYFDYAKGLAREALKFFKENSSNRFLCLELEFYASLYEGNLNEAEIALAELLQPGKGSQSEFRKSWHNYLLSCVAFMKGEYRQAHRTLHKATAIHKDKEGWNIGIRTLTILNMIELKMPDYADAAIENLRNYIHQSLKDAPVRKRDRLIAEVLTELKAKYYDFKETYQTQQRSLKQLASIQRELAWEVQSPELIVFHKWFESRLNDQPYTIVFTAEEVYSFEADYL